MVVHLGDRHGDHISANHSAMPGEGPPNHQAVISPGGGGGGGGSVSATCGGRRLSVPGERGRDH